METSQFLAKFLGLYILLMSIPLVVTPKIIRVRYESFLNNEAVMKLAGIVTVLLGLFLVLSHNLWVSDWRLLITCICWLVLIEGISIVYFPHRSRSLFRRIAANIPMFVSGIIGLAISLVLVFMGFFYYAA